MANESLLSFKLNTGAAVPGLGFGSGTICSAEEIKAAVLEAIKLGYRHFDTAPVYGTEVGIGHALAEAFEAGFVKREEVFITTKLRNDDHDPADVVLSLKRSLNDLKVAYVDLFMIHGPLRTSKGASFPPGKDEFMPLDIRSTWKAMEECYHLKLAKAIGVCNFSTKKLQDLLHHATVCPAAVQVHEYIFLFLFLFPTFSSFQVELHPIWQQRKLREYCRLHDIQVFAWSPLGGVGKAWGSHTVLDHPVVKDISVKHHKTPAQVILRWLTETGVVPVIKSYNSTRLFENLCSFGFNLDKEDHDRMYGISQKRLALWEWICNPVMSPSTSPYKTPEELWDGEV